MEAEKDLVRRSSGKKEDEVGGRLERPETPEEDGRKMALRAAAAVEEVGGFREEEEEAAVLLLGSSTARRSHRHKGQKPVKLSCG